MLGISQAISLHARRFRWRPSQRGRTWRSRLSPISDADTHNSKPRMDTNKQELEGLQTGATVDRVVAGFKTQGLEMPTGLYLLAGFLVGSVLGMLLGWLIARARAAQGDSRVEAELRQQLTLRGSELSEARTQLAEAG